MSYENKATIIRQGLHLRQKQLSRQIFNVKLDLTSMTPGQYLEQINKRDELLRESIKEMGYDTWHLCELINNAHYSRTRRLRHKIIDSVQSGSAIFLTLTFSDDTLSKTTFETRRRYVSRYLKKVSSLYVANLDYGSKNGREHYHAVVVSPGADLKSWHDYGAINARKIRSTTKDATKVSKYVSKLTNHAIKETASPNRMIYSRNR